MRSLKHILLLQFIILFSFSFLSLAQTVHITKTGSKYHSAGCSYLKSDISVDLKEAISRGLTACSRCNPPTVVKKDTTPTNTTSGSTNNQIKTTETKSTVTSGRCQATTKKGTQCKRNAKSGSNYCWQHGG